MSLSSADAAHLVQAFIACRRFQAQIILVLLLVMYCRQILVGLLVRRDKRAKTGTLELNVPRASLKCSPSIQASSRICMRKCTKMLGWGVKGCRPQLVLGSVVLLLVPFSVDLLLGLRAVARGQGGPISTTLNQCCLRSLGRCVQNVGMPVMLRLKTLQ